MADRNTPGGVWTDIDRATADWLGEDLRTALELGDDEHVEHYVIGIQVGTRKDDGTPRKCFAVACCRGTPAPSKLMNQVIEILGQRN